MERILLLTILFLFLLLTGALIVLNWQVTGHTTLNKYSFTKAICNQENYCKDYEITCEDGKIISKKAISEGVQFSQDWEDPRSEEMRNKWC